MLAMFYALSTILAPILPSLALMLWVAYSEERDLIRSGSSEGFWKTQMMYVSAGVCLALLSFVVYGVLVSPFI